MGISQYDPAALGRPAWNAGKQVGVKKPLKQRQIWAVRFFLDREGRMRDRALFDLAIDSKLRGCDLVKLKIGTLVTGHEILTQAMVVQFSSKLRVRSERVCVLGFSEGEEQWMTMPFPVVSIMAAGIAISFLTLGIFVATIGFSIGLDGSFFRMISAALLFVVGIVLLTPSLQTRLTTGGWADRRLRQASISGVSGQFFVGLMLGALWSPCVGPTLGAAALLAARGQHLGQVSLVMVMFSLGASFPLLILGFLSKKCLPDCATNFSRREARVSSSLDCCS